VSEANTPVPQPLFVHPYVPSSLYTLYNAQIIILQLILPNVTGAFTEYHAGHVLA
jgi:hypothetical protein